MKKIKIVFVILCYLIFGCNNVYADDATITSPSNNPGNATLGGSGTAGSGTNWYTNTRQIRIRVFDQFGNLKKNGYYLLDNSSCEYSQNKGILCETSGYDYDRVNDSSNVSCQKASINIGCIVSSNIEKMFYQKNKIWYSEGYRLKNYLEDNNFKNLKLLLESLEYRQTDYQNGDYIIIEPATLVKCAGEFYFGTSTALMMKNVSYRGSSGNVCATDDTNNGKTFINLFKTMSIAVQQNGLNSYPGDNNYSGMGYFKYDVSKLFDLSQSELNCLSGTISTSEEVKDIYGNVVAYCDNYLYINNNLGVSTFYGVSGELLIKKDSNLYTIYENNLVKKVVDSSNGIATATSKKICSVLRGKELPAYAKIPYSIEMYFANQGITSKGIDKETITYGEANEQYDTYEYETTYNLDLEEIYLEKISGKVVETPTIGKTDTVFGLLSKFNDREGSIEFKVIYNGDTRYSECKYSLESKIVDLQNSRLNLEFRVVDTEKPFNRTTMSNWSDGLDDSKNNAVVQKYIKDAVNSYGLDENGNKVINPKYKITLTPTDIKIIREFNKENPYDNYEAYCNRNNECKDAFVYDLTKGQLNRYENN